MASLTSVPDSRECLFSCSSSIVGCALSAHMLCVAALEEGELCRTGRISRSGDARELRGFCHLSLGKKHRKEPGESQDRLC